MPTHLARSLAAAAALLTTASLGRIASAAPLCSSLPNPLYFQVGDTQEPLLKALGKNLRESQVNPITIVYETSGSCTNIDAMYSGARLTTNPFYIPSAAEDPSWDPSRPSPRCAMDPAGVALDVVNSNVFVSACTRTPAPAGIGAFQGPVQPYVFVVPRASTQKGITAEEAYFAFGFGAAGEVKPWIDESLLFIRTPTKSTLLSMAAAIGVPAARWKGVPFDRSTEVLDAVATSTSPEKTIGILGAEIYDAHRDTTSALAFRAFKQRYAYYPDSTRTATDKQNVRDGHYVIWSPTVYLAPVDGQGVIKNARARYVVDMILSRTVAPKPDFDPLATIISTGLVPECAMKVTRSCEGGDLSLYSPAEPCGCFYESQVGNPGASCKACSDSAACGGGACRHGFCEAHTGSGSSSGGGMGGGAGDCVENPKTHVEIINACTTADKVDKKPTLPLLGPSGELPPLP